MFKYSNTSILALGVYVYERLITFQKKKIIISSLLFGGGGGSIFLLFHLLIKTRVKQYEIMRI